MTERKEDQRAKSRLPSQNSEKKGRGKQGDRGCRQVPDLFIVQVEARAETGMGDKNKKRRMKRKKALISRCKIDFYCDSPRSVVAIIKTMP